MIQLAVLSLSLLTVMSGAAVAPALAEIIAFFPNSPALLGKMILTTPALTIIPVSLLTGFLSSRVSRKKLLYSGIFFYIIGGAGGGTVGSIPLLLAMRAVLGVGVGILMPLATGIIADLYSGTEKTRIMGFSSASTNLGAIIATLLSGILASLHWRAAFSIYLLGLPVLFLVFAFIPEHHPVTKENDSPRTDQAAGNLARYGLWGAGMFFVMAAFYTIPVNIALYIVDNGLGDSRMAGLAMALMTASSFVTGLGFGRIYTFFGRWLPAMSLAAFSISFFCLSAFPSRVPMMGSLVLNGIGFGILVPLIMNGVTQKTGRASGTAGTSVVTCFLFAGQFASPVLTEKAAALTIGSGIQNIFLMLFFFIGAAALLAAISIPFTRKSQRRSHEK
ncbi:MFS transporter [Desulfospira joergensenii]|uniref:MFS transporter n=1 Tax=Desulfospira joergensenii TaxID=53329 RepID=UPI0003B6BFFB|nr:MFS transporter [Desulfospira joergensenii]